MVVVKVRETYDLCTVKNKMTVISIHTPKPDIIKRNFPGLLLQCKAYRPLQASVRIACASVQPLDPLGVGTAEGEVSPEDVFNPILYKALTNVGMSQLEARITALGQDAVYLQADVDGASSTIDVDTNTPIADEFPVYYGLLSNAHGWRHASPQSGLSMDRLRPLVYETLYNFADQNNEGGGVSFQNAAMQYPDKDGTKHSLFPQMIRGNAKPLPFINCTSFSYDVLDGSGTGLAVAGFNNPSVYNSEQNVPWINCCVAGIIIPPSKLHQLFYRMVVEWDIEFTGIRPISEIMNYAGLQAVGNATHYQNYSYAATKEMITGTKDSILESDTCMVSANVDVKKVM